MTRCAASTGAYLSVTNVLALMRLRPASGGDKDVEILALRHQITVLVGPRDVVADRPAADAPVIDHGGSVALLSSGQAGSRREHRMLGSGSCI